MDDEVLLQVLQSLEDKLMETSAAEAAKESLDTVLCRAVNKQLSVSDSSPKSAVRVQGERSQAKSDPPDLGLPTLASWHKRLATRRSPPGMDVQKCLMASEATFQVLIMAPWVEMQACLALSNVRLL